MSWGAGHYVDKNYVRFLLDAWQMDAGSHLPRYLDKWLHAHGAPVGGRMVHKVIIQIG